MIAWIKKGLILGRCRQRGYGGLREPPVGAFARDDVADELAGETVAKAPSPLRDDVLMKGRWDPTRGATIKTYFIGQCLIRFPNIYRSWLANEASQDAVLVDNNDLFEELAGAGGVDPADVVVIRQEIEARFEDISDERLKAGRRSRVVFLSPPAALDFQQLLVTERYVLGGQFRVGAGAAGRASRHRLYRRGIAERRYRFADLAAGNTLFCRSPRSGISARWRGVIMGVIAWIVLGAAAGLIAERVTGNRTGLLLATGRAEGRRHQMPAGAAQTVYVARHSFELNVPPRRQLSTPLRYKQKVHKSTI